MIWGIGFIILTGLFVDPGLAPVFINEYIIEDGEEALTEDKFWYARLILALCMCLLGWIIGIYFIATVSFRADAKGPEA